MVLHREMHVRPWANMVLQPLLRLASGASGLKAAV